MENLDTKVKLEVQDKIKANASCAVCGIHGEVLNDNNKLQTLSEYFNSKHFSFVNENKWEICVVCTDFTENVLLLQERKVDVIVELESIATNFQRLLEQRKEFEHGAVTAESEEIENTFEEFTIKQEIYYADSDVQETELTESGSFDNKQNVDTQTKDSDMCPLKLTKRISYKRRKRYNCYFCGKLFGEKRVQFEHTQALHLNEFPWNCPKLCGYKTARRDNFLTHLKCMHPEEKEKQPDLRRKENRKKPVCPDCGKIFKRMDTLKEHLKVHQVNRPIHTCTICSKGYLSASSLNEHFQVDHGNSDKVFHCPVNDCQHAPFPSQKRLNKHISFSHRESTTTCNDCGRHYKSKIAYRYHKKHNKTCAQLTGKTLTRFNCSYKDCSRSFLESGTLKKHILACHERVTEEPHNCELCKETFKQRRDLQSHMKQCHGGIPCRVCSKKCSSFDYFAKHLKKDHAAEKTKWILKCKYPTCNATAVFSYMLLKHEKVVHQEKKALDCYFCKLKLSDKNTLERHMKNRHLLERCSPGYSREEWKQILQRRRKDNESNRQCKDCLKTFTSIQNYKKHMETHLPESQRKTFKCSLCKNRYLESRRLKEHLVADHGQPGPSFICPYSHYKAKTFPSKARLNRHIRLAHGGKSKNI